MSQSPTGFALETRAPEILRAALPCGALSSGHPHRDTGAHTHGHRDTLTAQLRIRKAVHTGVMRKR